MKYLQLENFLSRHLFIVFYRHLVRTFLLRFPVTLLRRLPCQSILLLEARETYSTPPLRVLLGNVRMLF